MRLLKKSYFLLELTAIILVGLFALSHYAPDVFSFTVFGELKELLKTKMKLFVFGVAAVYALFYFFVGMFFNGIAGNWAKSLKNGFIIGLGTGLSKLWIYAFAWGVGAFTAWFFWMAAPLWKVIAALTLAFILLGVKVALEHFWRRLEMPMHKTR